jgi:hypothetical protein
VASDIIGIPNYGSPALNDKISQSADVLRWYMKAAAGATVDTLGRAARKNGEPHVPDTS